MNKNNRKEHLYRAAFKLFLMKQFDAVSISDIEKESGMTRGAITYYGGDKKGLFYDVVKQFIVDTQNIENKMSNTEPEGFYRLLCSWLSEYHEQI